MTGDVLVLCYHALSPTWKAALSVTPKQLEQQLTGLVRRGYEGSTLAGALAGGGAGRTLVVTFDDAFHSVSELALPVMSRLGLPGTVFAPTRFVEQGEPLAWPGTDHWLRGPDEGELRPLSWDALRALAMEGWEIGSHSHSHPRLTGLADGELTEELVRSRALCESRLGTPCLSVAYPYGDFDRRVEVAAGRAGYRFGVTLPRRLAGDGPLACPRVGIYRGDGQVRFRLKASRGTRRLRASRAWVLLDRARRAASSADR